MSKDKQIEEMAKELVEAHHEMDVAWTNHFIDKEKFPKPKPEHTLLAEHLYNASYRKQSEGEWVSQADGTHYCSNCGHDATYNFDGTEVCGVACTFCGAMMKGGAE